MTASKQIETCAHVRKGTESVVWFLSTGTVVLCAKCSKTAVRTVRASIKPKPKNKVSA